MKNSLISLLFSLALLAANPAQAQKEWYFGMELGPKYDHFKTTRSGTSTSGAKLEVVRDIAATAGAKIGVNVDDRFNFELGLYRNNYNVAMAITSSAGNLLFEKELVNTLNTYMVPLSFNLHFPLANQKQVFWFGGGLSLLLSPKTDFLGAYSSPTKTLEANGSIVDQMQYNRYQHLLEGSIYTFNLTTGLDVAIYENIFLSLNITGRIGIAGTDSYLVELNDNSGKSLYKVSNNGTSIQSCFGFKYFFKTTD
jgi:hypothetical protein